MNSTSCIIPPPLFYRNGSLKCPGDPLPELRGHSNPLTSLLGRVEMVGHGDVQMEWKDIPQEGDKTWSSIPMHQLADTPTTSCIAHLRERYRGQQLLDKAPEPMLRTKTNKFYDSLFAKWHHWCSDWDLDPFCGPIAQVANFLAHLYKEGYKYSSVNVTISSVHVKVDGCSVGQHPLICRLVKGVYHAKPPLPHYLQTLGYSESIKLS